MVDGEKDFERIHQDHAMKANTPNSRFLSDSKAQGLQITNSVKLSGRHKYSFVCKSGHNFTADKVMISKRGYWCPDCANAVKRYTQESATELMMRVGLQPIEVYSGSRDPWKCKCINCGVIVKKRLRSVLQTGTLIGCQKCSQRAKSNAQKIDSEIAISMMLAREVKPLAPYVESGIPWKSECLRCHQVIYPRLRDLKRAKDPCINCSGRKVNPKKAVKLCQEFGLDPIGSYPGNTKKWKMKCMSCGKIVSSLYGNVTRKKRNGWQAFGCSECSFERMGRRYSINSDVAKQKFLNVNLEMLGEYVNARLPIKMRCLLCGELTKQTLNGVMNGKTCKYCKQTGIKYGAPSYLYLIYNDIYRSIKIGISNVEIKHNRLESHKKSGWQEYKTYFFDTGDQAAIYETELLRWVRLELKLPIHLTKEMMPQGGFTETIDAEEITFLEIEKKLITLVSSDS